MTYIAPVGDQLFALEALGCFHPENSGVLDFDLAAGILEESGRFAREVFAPLNALGDREGARWTPEGVTLPAGFAAAYRAFVDAGWASVSGPAEYGGQELPFCISTAILEQLMSANMAFGLNPMLTAGAVTAIAAHASPDLQSHYLPALIAGRWTGTMNLTEPQAGSDVGALRAAARPAGDGRWLIKGTKIFISWGDHDLAENIIHLVLARTPGAPAGSKGISLFLVPKILPDGRRNDVRCVSIEHKLGIHASPTCTMSFGDDDQCIGWMIGEEHGGLAAMFTMMNHARISVGVQGVAMAERAAQAALVYASERVQSSPIGGNGTPVPIIQHADVRNMVMTLRSTTQAIRALVYHAAAQVDIAHKTLDPDTRRRAKGRADLLTPIAKAYATDMGADMTSLAIQVFGGMGYVEETGVAQHFRDARIAPIYEGTNGIQAIDLVWRKLDADGGAHWRELIEEISAFAPQEGEIIAAREDLEAMTSALRQASAALKAMTKAERAHIATLFLRLCGIVISAWLLARQAETAAQQLEKADANRDMLKTKIGLVRWYCLEMAPLAGAICGGITDKRRQLSATDFMFDLSA